MKCSVPTFGVPTQSSVLDLRITHDRFGGSSDPSLNGHLHYPNDIDKSLNETVVDKMRMCRSYIGLFYVSCC